MTSFFDRKLLSVFCLPGHQMPEIPRQCGAAETSRIGLPLRSASRSPPCHVPYQAIGAVFFSAADAVAVAINRAAIAASDRMFIVSSQR